MSASETMVAAPTAESPYRLRYLAVFGNLLRKELRESRGAVIAGLSIFWVMPAFLEIVYAVLADPLHELIGGIAFFLLLLAGWFYAIVVGAHTVCRDWGRPEEHFLLGRPVSPPMVAGAKLVAGAVVLALVVMAALLWDLMIAKLGGQFDRWEADDFVGFVILGVAVCIALVVGYVLAFTGAFVTRQTLTSVLLAVLVLLVWAVAPLLSSRLTFLHPAFLSEVVVRRYHSAETLRGVWALMGAPFLTAAAVCIAGCIGVTLVSCTRERVIRIGHQPLAWIVAVAVLALFGAAMTEVGNSLTIRDRKQLFGAEEWRYREPARLGYAIGRKDDQFFVAWPHYQWHDRRHRNRVLSISNFGIDEAGRIRDFRQADLLGLEGVRYVWAYPWPSQLVVDEQGHWFIIDVLRDRTPVTRSPGKAVLTKSALQRVELAWPPGQEPQVVSEAVAAFPDEVPTVEAFITSYAVTDRYAYIVWGTRRKAGDSTDAKAPRDSTLCVFDWSDGLRPEPRYRIPLQRYANVQITDGRLWLFWPDTSKHTGPNSEYKLARFDANNPAALVDSQPWPARSVPQAALFEHIYEYMRFAIELGYVGTPTDLSLESYPQALSLTTAPLPGFGIGFGIWSRNVVVNPTREGTLIYVSNRLGLRAARQDASARWKVVSQCRASPLSLMFRGWVGTLTLLDDSLLVESLSNALVVYDLSEPGRPRRAGFYNPMVQTNGMRGRPVFATDRHLLLFEGNLITVLDRPR